MKSSQSPVNAALDDEIDNLLLDKKRKSPVAGPLDGKSRKSPKSPATALADDFDSMFSGRKSRTPTSEAQAISKKGVKSPVTATNEGFDAIFARKAAKSPLADGLEGRKKLTKSPLSTLDDDSFNTGLSERKPQAVGAKGSYISSLLGDDKPDADEFKPRTETSYISKLLDTSEKPDPIKVSTACSDLHSNSNL